MSAFEQGWLYGALACAAGIALALYVFAGWIKSCQRKRGREEMRRHLRDAA